MKWRRPLTSPTWPQGVGAEAEVTSELGEASEEEQAAEVEEDIEEDTGEALEVEAEEIGHDLKAMTDTDVSVAMKWAIGPEIAQETTRNSPEIEETDQRVEADKREVLETD